MMLDLNLSLSKLASREEDPFAVGINVAAIAFKYTHTHTHIRPKLFFLSLSGLAFVGTKKSGSWMKKKKKMTNRV